ncbi:HotDog domain-containing protein [Podospora fimiseda]|uniref:HotDog domain-containing protein n=1 Tax=Podospora fimiseda TaxID=252190 RepID=A0AAN7GRB5_9PEZI|nr:HotDog domain-containing protein [Podospora fimiseda]
MATDIQSRHDLKQVNKIQEEKQIEFFKSIPWCLSLLTSSPLTIAQSYSRSIRNNLEDALINRSLNKPDAIPHYITFYSPQPLVSNDSLNGYITQLSSLISLGPMVNGWEGICHGGIVITLLDEVMGQLFSINKQIGKMRDGVVFTGYLNTRFKRPVKTGTKEKLRVVMVVARLKKVEGRKYTCEGVVLGPKEGGKEDGELEELTSAEAVFVQVKEKL